MPAEGYSKEGNGVPAVVVPASAPPTVKYLVQVADAGVPQAQAMGALATGITKNTTSTGVQTIAVAGVDYQLPLVAGTDYVTPAAALATFVVAAGKAGGQTVIGGTAASENLILQSTSHATKGKVYLGSGLTVWSDGVDGSARLNVDTTGLTTTVPVLVKNGKSLSGIEVQVTGTASTGFVLRDSARVQKGALGYAVALNDWLTGAPVGSLVLSSATSMRIDAPGAAGILIAGATNAFVQLNGSAGAVIGYGGASLTFAGTVATLAACSLVITSTTSTSAVSLYVNGDPNTGIGAIGGADTLSVVCGGNETIRWTTTGCTATNASTSTVWNFRTGAAAGNSCLTVVGGSDGTVNIRGYGVAAASTIMGITTATCGFIEFTGQGAAGVGGMYTLGGKDIVFGTLNIERFRIDHANLALKLTDAFNIAAGTTTGTKIGTATAQKLGFWNATPVVQQILATGGGATVDNVITFLQTVGLCKQS